MSYEAWGEPEEFDVELLYKRGWDCNEDASIWWKIEELEKKYTIDEAIIWYEDEIGYEADREYCRENH